MATITERNLVDAEILLGVAQTRLDGFGEDKFNFGPATDQGAMVSGVDGDVMHVSRASNGYTLTLTLMQTSPGIRLINTLHRTVRVFPITIRDGEFSFIGFANMTNAGEMSASLGTTTRTITLGCSYVSGDIDSAPGSVLQVL